MKLRDKSARTGDKSSDRPLSLAERLSWLEGAQDGWKSRVEEKDVKQFTVEGKMQRTGRSTSFHFLFLLIIIYNHL